MTYAELSESQARRARQFREAQTNATSVYCDAERDLKELQAENAKLRELCGLMFERLHALVDDGWCPVSPGDEMTPYDVFDRYDELVQLGIEVDA